MLAPVHRMRLWLAGLALVALAAGLVTLSGDWLFAEDPLGLVAASLGWHHEAPASNDVPLETFLPGQKRDLSPEKALAENLASPIDTKNPAAPPFVASWLGAGDLARAGECMASAIYHEAAGEPEAGQMAVAQVILNRLRHPRYPKSVCDVVYQGADRATGCQFTFTCDGSLARKPDAAGLAHARAIADAALHGATSPLAGQATHYHTIWIVPLWAREMRKVAIVGHHVFYRPPGAYGAYPALGGGAGVVAASTGLPAQGAEGVHGAAPHGLSRPDEASPSTMPGRGAEPGRLAPAADVAGVGTASSPAPSAAAHGQARSYFGASRRREGTLALPGAP